MSTPLHLTVSGPAGAPAVVLLHAIATSGAMWRSQAQMLGSDYRVIVPDLPGHGRSAVPEGDVTLETYADAVLGALDGLGVERAAVIGLSFGSMIAQVIAGRTPERVGALVLSNGIAFAPEAVRSTWAERIAAATRDGMAAQVDGTLDRWFTPSFRHDPVAAGIGALVAATPLDGYLAAAGVIATLDNRALLPRISAPTLVLAGEQDAGAPAAAVKGIADAVPGAAVATLPAGHLMNIETADAYNRLLKDFLARTWPA